MIENDGAPDRATNGPMNKARRTMTKAEAAKILRHSGFPPHVSEHLLASLPDPIDLDRIDPKLVVRYGLTAEQLMDALGGSP